MEETARDNEVILMIVVMANLMAMEMVLGRVISIKVTVMAKMIMTLKLRMTIQGDGQSVDRRVLSSCNPNYTSRGTTGSFLSDDSFYLRRKLSCKSGHP